MGQCIDTLGAVYMPEIHWMLGEAHGVQAHRGGTGKAVCYTHAKILYSNLLLMLGAHYY